MYYAARFTAPDPNQRTRKLHPYSLDEFGSRPISQITASKGRHSEKLIPKLARMESLRTGFEAEDLAWRLQQRRLDRISHEHWAKSNLAFSQAKAEAEERASMGSLDGDTPDPLVMEDFYKTWVEANAQEYERYQQEWIKGIFGHIRPAIRAVYRDWRWKLELWRMGI
ncbi:hypothetical protein EMMF5_005843 [Cystobasidiomycetes sp. EMM_F5]